MSYGLTLLRRRLLEVLENLPATLVQAPCAGTRHVHRVRGAEALELELVDGEGFEWADPELVA